MPQPPDDGLGPAGSVARRQLAVRRLRCLRAARALSALGAVGIAFLCASGARPAAVAIPVFLCSTSALLGAASAGLFAYVAGLHLGRRYRDGGDDDDRGPGGGWDEPYDWPGGGGFAVDWRRFEREFRAYCERAGVGEI
jgi:hypothetical protein